tara:strand:- start:139 stop:492 length:354 start_codon:yes stop_codon:yes gene_type:complete
MKNLDNPFLIEAIRLIHLSESKYKQRDFKGSIEHKHELHSILQNEVFLNEEIMNKYKLELSRLYNSRFDLIKDHKKRIDDVKRKKIIKLLEEKSKNKYLNGDYEGAIKALRRSERYQ